MPDSKAYHLEADRCALVVVDIQERLMRVIDRAEQVSRNAEILLRVAAVLGLPVVATTQYQERIGPFLPGVREALGDARIIDKMEFDCLANPAVRQALTGLSPAVDTVIFCGVETHICIYQSVVGALTAGYRAWVAADAVSSRTPANRRLGLARIREIGGVVAPTEMIVYDLLGRAGTPAFKELLPLFK